MKGHFEAKKHAIRQTQDGWVVSFVIHPNDVAPDFAAAPLGTIFMVGYQTTEDAEEAPVAQPPRDPDPSKARKAREQYESRPAVEQAVTRAAMLVKDKEYWAWVGCYNEDDADKFMKWSCQIRSKADINSDPEAYRRFIAHELEYRHSREKPAA